MDLSDAPGEAEFRLRAQAWLADSLPRLPWPEPPDLEGKAPFWRQWQGMLFASGYAGLTWPKEYGGQGLSERMRAEDERRERARGLGGQVGRQIDADGDAPHTGERRA